MAPFARYTTRFRRRINVEPDSCELIERDSNIDRHVHSRLGRSHVPVAPFSRTSGQSRQMAALQRFNLLGEICSVTARGIGLR